MSDLEEAKKSLTAFLEETEKRLAAFRKATDIWPPGENLPPNRFFDEAQIRAKAYGYWLKAEAEISKLKAENERLLDTCIAGGFIGNGTQLIGDERYKRLLAAEAENDKLKKFVREFIRVECWVSPDRRWPRRSRCGRENGDHCLSESDSGRCRQAK